MLLSQIRRLVWERRRKAAVNARQTDYRRWEASDNWAEEWEARARLAASWISANETVLDLGCGQMVLERYLPGSARYIPCDCVARDERTIVCDFNQGMPPIYADIDTICLLGVLEYIFELPTFVSELTASRKRIIASYCPSDLGAGFDRATRGWVNGLTTMEFEQLFTANGFKFDKKVKVDEFQFLCDLRPV